MNELGVFAKFWEPGRVKTRLAAAIGDERSSQIYQCFVETLLERLQGAADRQIIAYTPAVKQAAFDQLVDGTNWQVEPQSDGDLGERMSQFFSVRFQGGATKVVLLGSDSPTIPQRFVAQAFHELDTNELVFGPTEDGGYYLVGMRQPIVEVFRDISWSTPSVWEETLERASAINKRESLAMLPTWYDVDTLADLWRLHQELASSGDRPSLRKLARLCSGLINKSDFEMSKSED